MEKRNILRKMEFELIFTKIKDFEHVIRLFKMSSKIDYFQYKDLFKQAVHKWISIHPLLNAKIEQIESDYYFVKIQDNDDDEFENIQFLTIDSKSLNKSNNDYNTIVDLIIENESFNKIDFNNKLWRLTLIRSTDNNYDFDIIFTIHHSITDGRNVIYIFQQLLSIFEDLYTNKMSEIKSYSILPGLYELFLKEADNSPLIIPQNKLPSFIEIDQAKSIETTNQKYKDCLNVIINSETNKLSIVDLIETAKLNQLKFKFITFNQDDSMKLFQKLKQYKVKLQPFLNVLFAMTFQKVYQKFGNENEINRSIFHVVNLKPFLEDKTIFGENINEKMGYYGQLFTYEVKHELHINEFWINVKKENELMIAKLEKGEQFPKKNSNEILVKINYNELFLDFLNSNLGIISQLSSKNMTTKMQTIKNVFINIKSEYSEYSFKRFIFNNFVTIDNKLNWSLVYNSYYVNDQLIEFIYKETLNIFKQILLI